MLLISMASCMWGHRMYVTEHMTVKEPDMKSTDWLSAPRFHAVRKAVSTGFHPDTGSAGPDHSWRLQGPTH